MATIIGLISAVLLIILLYQVSKSNELLNLLKGKEEVDGAQNFNATMLLVVGVLGLILSVWSAWYFQDRYLPEPSSEHGVWLRTMFQWTLIATVPVFLITNFLLFYFSYRYRARKGKIAHHFAHSTMLEMVWTGVPAIVMVFLVVEGMRNWYKITGPAPKDAMVVEVTAQQFKWDFRYSGKDNKLGDKQIKLISPDNYFGQDWKDAANQDDIKTTELVLPVNKPVLMKINALDVLHSFYLPHFRVKMDAVPGIPTQFWFVPTKTTAEMRTMYKNDQWEYELACAELCGKAHYNMKAKVTVLSEEEYTKWISSQKSIYAEMKAAAQPAVEATLSAPADTLKQVVPAATTVESGTGQPATAHSKGI